MHNLPLHTITSTILLYLDKASPNYSEELANAIRYDDLNPEIIYNNDKQPISNVAEITENRQIIIYENFIAFLWCLSYAVVTFYHEERTSLDLEDNHRLQDAFSILDYGQSLKEKWNHWPVDAPNPKNSGNEYVEEANVLTIFAMSYILAHEIGHHQLGHELTTIALDIEEARNEEFSADKYAFDVLIGGYIDGYEAKNNSINVGVILGLGSILFLEKSWEAEGLHPDIDARLTKILQNIQDV